MRGLLEHQNRVVDVRQHGFADGDQHHADGIQAIKPGDLDGAIKEMIDVKRPVLFDCRVAALENCFPMIPSGKAHNEMLLPAEATDEATATAKWSDLGLTGNRHVRDLWRQQDLGTFAGQFQAPVARHGGVLVKVSRTK